jgi:hypothetical protein
MSIKDWFSNTWMDNPLYHVQIAHALGGLALVLIAAFFWQMTGVLAMLGVGVPVVALKEFWYDLKFEIPNDTVAGSGLDFLAYMIGATAGLGLALIKFYALHSH